MSGLLRFGAFLAVLSHAACSNPVGTCVPRNPGNVNVRVADLSGSPVPNVKIEIWEVPNCVGSTFGVGQWTNQSGETVFDFMEAGNRRVEMTVPAGFTAPEGSVRRIDIVQATTVTVQFTLMRQRSLGL